MCIVDLNKAFDRIKQQYIMKILIRKKIPAKITNIIKNITYAIKWNKMQLGTTTTSHGWKMHRTRWLT